MKTSPARTTACSLLQASQLLIAVTVFAFCAPNLKGQLSSPTPEPSPTTSPYKTLATIGVTQLRSFNGSLDGSGVDVTQAEAPKFATNRFEVRPSYVGRPDGAQTFVTWISSVGTADSFPNNVGTELEHADYVGSLFYGRGNPDNPEGVAYGVNHVDNWEANNFRTTRIDPSGGVPIRGKVVNQSFSFNDQQYDQSYDNYVAKYGTIFASSINNGGPPLSPGGTAYNLIGVAAYETSMSSVGPTSDGRSKPDITAPGDSTSFTAPLVAGAAAILVQAATTLGYTGDTYTKATDPRTVKALLLNGAVKPLYVDTPAKRWMHTETAPLDTRYGAGILNVFNSYKQFQAGQRGPGGYSTVQSGWDFRPIAASTAQTYSFTLTGGPFNGTATLVWNRQQNQASINDLNLSLSSGGTVIASSASTVDNVEHLFLESLPAGTYDLKVERINNVVSGDENYALAFNFAPNQLTSAVSRKTHGGAGIFDIPLPLAGAEGVECRSGGVNGDYQVVFNFAVPVTFNTASVATGAGSVSSTSGSGTNSITVNLTGVPNAQTATVALFGLNDGSNMSDIGVKLAVLVGDTNGDRFVNSGDVTQTRNRSGLVPDSANFRSDVNVDGSINSGDVTVVRSNSGNALP